MKTFFLILAILPLIWCQVPVLEVQHYLSASNATIREAFTVDLSQIGSPFTLEVAIIKSAEMVTGRGELEADFSLFANPSSIDDLFDFDGDDFEWNTGANVISSNRTFARVFHPNCYSLLRGGEALNTIRMEFTSELKDLESYNPSSVIFTRYVVYAQRIDLAADGSTQSRQSSSWASQTPLTLIVGNPSQNDQSVYDVTVTLSNPTGSALPFSLARVGSPNLCIDDDDTTSEDETRLVTIPSGSSYSFLLSNVVAGNWAILLDSVAGSRNETYSINTSVQTKSTDRNGWQCDRFGYCTAAASPSRTNPTEVFTSPSVIQGDQNNQNPASRMTIGFLFVFAFIFVAFF